jgi:hypothetical protein
MLKVGTTELPAPKSVTYTDNKLWSDNTGRLDSGYFVGDLIGIKRKYEVVWPPLTPTQLSTVRTAVNGQFAEVTITDIGDDDNNTSTTDVTLNAYFGDFSVKAYSWKDGIKYAIDASISIIER